MQITQSTTNVTVSGTFVAYELTEHAASMAVNDDPMAPPISISKSSILAFQIADAPITAAVIASIAALTNPAAFEALKPQNV